MNLSIQVFVNTTGMCPETSKGVKQSTDPPQKPLTLQLLREIHTVLLFQEVGREEMPDSFDTPTNTYRLRTMQTLIDVNTVSTRAL